MPNLSKCKADCCRWIGFPISNPTPAKKDYLLKHGCKLNRLSHTQWMVMVPSKCDQLTDDNLCGLHGKPEKPLFCRKFDENNTKGYWIPPTCILSKEGCGK